MLQAEGERVDFVGLLGTPAAVGDADGDGGGTGYWEEMGVAWRTHQPGSYTGHLAVLAPQDDLRQFGSTLRWNRVHRGPLKVVQVPGDHLSMLREPDVLVVAASLSDALAEAAGH